VLLLKEKSEGVFMKKVLMFLVLFVMVGVFAACGGRDDAADTHEIVEDVFEVPAFPVFEANYRGHVGGFWWVTVNSTSINDLSLPSALRGETADEGYVFVGVEVTITRRGQTSGYFIERGTGMDVLLHRGVRAVAMLDDPRPTLLSAPTILIPPHIQFAAYRGF